jgi:hypothetical protein
LFPLQEQDWHCLNLKLGIDKKLKLVLHLANPKHLPKFPKKVQKVGSPKSKPSSLLELALPIADTFRHGDPLAGNDGNIYRQMLKI